MTKEKQPQKIEEIIVERLEGDMKEQALKFVEYLDENQMQPKQWFDENFWHIPYGEEYWLFGIFLEQGKWNIFLFSGDYKGEIEEDVAKTIYNHVNTCTSCHGENTDICPKGKDMEIFGKKFKNACIQFTIHFENPSDDDIQKIKKIMDITGVSNKLCTTCRLFDTPSF